MKRIKCLVFLLLLRFCRLDRFKVFQRRPICEGWKGQIQSSDQQAKSDSLSTTHISLSTERTRETKSSMNQEGGDPGRRQITFSRIPTYPWLKLKGGTLPTLWQPCEVLGIVRFSEADLQEWMRFVIFRARCRSALPGRFLRMRCFTLCITVEAEPRIAKQYKC